MEEDVAGSVILINKFNVMREAVDQFLRYEPRMLHTLSSSQDLSLHRCIVELLAVLCLSTMQFLNLLNILSKPLTIQSFCIS